MTDDQTEGQNSAAEQAAGRRIIAQLADELMPVLIARLEASALGELEVRENGWRVRLRRPISHNGVLHADQTVSPAAPAETRPGEATRSRERAERTGPDRPERHERASLTSPAVGYFTPREGISAGSSLRNGDVVGHVDVLGVKQEVVAPVDAVLARLEVEPGQAVEYGELIARLEPEPRGYEPRGQEASGQEPGD